MTTMFFGGGPSFPIATMLSLLYCQLSNLRYSAADDTSSSGIVLRKWDDGNGIEWSVRIKTGLCSKMYDLIQLFRYITRILIYYLNKLSKLVFLRLKI